MARGRKDVDLFIAKLETLIKPTVVTANTEWADSIPEWLFERIRIQRFVEHFKELRGEKVTEASDEEAFAYLYTASLTAPLDDTWSRIYLYLGYKIAPEKMRNQMENLNIPKELNDYEKHLLDKLKKYIYKVRRKRERERVRQILKEISKYEG